MAAPTDTQKASDLDSAGTLGLTTIIPCAQTTAAEKLQQLPWGSFLWTGTLTGSDFGNAIKPITPVVFASTNNTEDYYGTARSASEAAITAGTTGRVLTADNQTILFKNNIKNTGTIASGDIDSLTSVNPAEPNYVGALTITGDVYASTFGTLSFFNGGFGYAPSINYQTKKLYIKNTRQPLYKQGLSGSYIPSTAPTNIYPMAVTIEAYGADTAGIGMVVITIGTNDVGLVFNSSHTYELMIHGQYFAKF